MQLPNILHRRDCLLHPKEMLTPSYHPKRIHFGLHTLTLPLPVTSFFPRQSPPNPITFSGQLASWDQSIVGKSTRIKAKRSLGLGPPITPIAFVSAFRGFRVASSSSGTSSIPGLISRGTEHLPGCPHQDQHGVVVSFAQGSGHATRPGERVSRSCRLLSQSLRPQNFKFYIFPSSY
jgi:hypothetical protein